jgi:hypothetical protein
VSGLITLPLLMLLPALSFADGSDTAMQVQSRITLSVKGSTRASLYDMSNKIVTVDGKTHIAWLDALADTMVATYDHATGELTEPVLVGSGFDNHAGPAICADSQGYLYVVFGPHHGPFQFARSVRPNDASDWEKLPDVGEKCTYPSLVCDAQDTLHLAYRGGDVPCRVLYQRRPAGGEWTEPRELVSAAVPSGYTQFCNALTVAADGSLHMAFHVYDVHPEAGKAAGHMVSRNGGGSWTLMDGTPLELPVTPQTPGVMLEQGEALDMRVGGITCDAKSRPCFPVAHLEGETDLVLWRWRDGWESISLRPIVEGAVGFPPRFGQPNVATIAEGRLYIGAGVRERGNWVDRSTESYLLISDDLGDSFTVLRVSEPDPNLPNWGPSLERPVGHNSIGRLFMLWTHGLAGASTSDAATVTEVMLGVLGQY